MRHLTGKFEIECKNRVNDKTKYFESLINNHVSEYENKCREKDEAYENMKSAQMNLDSECSNLKDDLELKELNLQQMKERESDMVHEIRSLNDKLSLMKDVNTSSQMTHDEAFNAMKNNFVTKLKERETELKNEFLDSLNNINDSVVVKHKDLIESYNMLVEYVTDLQTDLDQINKESSKQSE